MKFDNLISIARSLIDMPRGKNKHFSFILKKHRILSIGWNNKTDTFAMKYGYPYFQLHSELHAIKKFPLPIEEIHKCKLVNIRISTVRGNPLRMAKPCKYCDRVLQTLSPREIWYSNNEGVIQCA